MFCEKTCNCKKYVVWLSRGRDYQVNYRTMNGRKRIYSNYSEINDANVLEVLGESLGTHKMNAEQIEFLYQYYTGNQPIFDRIKEVRSDIKNFVLRNIAYEIVEFKKGYNFGNGVQYIKRGACIDKGEKVDDNAITALNELMMTQDKETIDLELGESLLISGIGHRFVKMVKTTDVQDAPFEISTLDSRKTFVVYNSGIGEKPLMSVNISQDEKGNEFYFIYTPNSIYEVSNKDEVTKTVNTLGMIPVIEYNLNPSRIGAFEPVITQLDAINKIESNRVDAIEQIVQSILVFENCDIDDTTFEQLKHDLAIKVRGDAGNPARIYYVSADLNQDQTQTALDDMYTSVLTVCFVPDRNASAGGNTGAALQVAEGWASAEARAKADMIMFKKAERNLLRVVMRIINISTLDYPCKNLCIGDIDIKADREKNQNLLTKTQGLLNLLEAGVDPAIACASVGLFNDPQLVADSSPNMKKWAEQAKTQVTSKKTEDIQANTKNTLNNPNNANIEQ